MLPSGTIRPLKFPLNRNADTESDTPNSPDVGFLDLSEWVTPDPEERVNIVLNLSLNEYVALASAIDAGRDLAYGDNSIYIWWIWVRSVTSLNLCADILECIESTPELQEAIAKYAIAAPIPINAAADPDILSKDLISDNTGCDNDRLFGAITGIVDLINDLAEDFIEIMQDNVNTVSRVAELIEVVPGVGEIIPADLLTLVENFIEDMINLYQAAYTQVLRDTYRCDLFCLALDDCNINFEEVMQYFADKMTEPLIIDDFGDFIGLYITGAFTGETLVAAWHMFVIGVAAYGSSVLNITADQMTRMISAMFNDPDPDWDLLCACANTWTSTLDFTVSDYGIVWLPDDNTNPIGQWVNGLGLTTTDVVYNGNDQRWLRGSISFDETTITDVQGVGNFTKGYNGSQQGLTALDNQIHNNGSYAGLGTRLNYSDFALNVSTPVDVSGNGNVTADELIITWRPNLQAYSGGAVVTSIVLSGTGTKPSQLP